MIDRARLIQEATAAVCGAIFDDYRKGRLHGVEGVTAEEKLDELVRRRQPQIAAWIRDRLASLNRKAATCAECGCVATTVMGGADYCDRHARNHRAELPAGMGAAA